MVSMNEYIENLNKTYKSGQFSLVNGIMVVEVKKVRHYNVLLSTKQREWISSFCLKVSNNCLKHITKALAGAIIDTHQKYPHLQTQQLFHLQLMQLVIMKWM